MNLNALAGTRIGVLGWGVNHEALAGWLVRHGVKQLAVLDEFKTSADRDSKLPIRDWRFGPTAFDQLADFDLVFRSPGIPLDHPKLVAARAAGVEISSQTKLFFALSPAPTIGVTGTKGKGTTASIIVQMIEAELKTQNSKLKSYLAGNIGRDPFEFLDELTPDDWVVLELSSFQLEDLNRSPRIAVVLTIGEDHLDHHRSLDEYVAAKRPIVAYQTTGDDAVLSADDTVSASFAAATGARVHWYSRTQSVSDGVDVRDSGGEQLFELVSQGQRSTILPVQQLQLRGRHNWENVAAACAAAHLAGVSIPSMATAAAAFRPLPHRLEDVGTIDGVTFVNDSYATAPLPAIAALRSFDQPIILILGGQGKGADYTELIRAVQTSSVRAVVCYGTEGPVFKQRLEQPGFDRQILYERTFDDAVEAARTVSQPGDVVLLSPSATSYDQFRSYTQRGERFRALVHGIERIKNQESRIKQGSNV